MPAICRFARQPLALTSLVHALPVPAYFFSYPSLSHVILESYFLSLFSFSYFITEKTVTTLANKNIAHLKTNKRNPDVRFNN
ncbi:hypothetical protein BKF61_001938 [Salmonella enterica subsp. enterica serovar Lika]|nr:hypothetical protein [Salmonella enterica subsp. enterica serovar Banana]EDA9108467.1 hypothetical protein [Salmonella enterica subsp. enterica serovar Gdansk]EDV6733147.1 hypothetical protein [Salmonella enterica subsp. enterica serovar Lika]EHX9261479.1 hypothetical protein [Salmonella enterica subsp. enterica]EMD9041396.1 hypothetical protein [Salmonella enterica]